MWFEMSRLAATLHPINSMNLTLLYNPSMGWRSGSDASAILKRPMIQNVE
jgi:hypothetical protein